MSKLEGDYLARLCWNSEGWIHPTGEAPQLEASDTYASKEGFGHEEWLFNDAWLLDGYKYGYVQPLRASQARLAGKTIRLRLYSIGPRGWFYVGVIDRCEVLDSLSADSAVKKFRERRWFEEMASDVKTVHGKVRGLNYGGLGFFNLRFKPGSLRRLTPLVSVPEHSTLSKMRRYRLVATPAAIETKWPTRQARPEPKKLTPYAQSIPRREQIVDREHDTLQTRLYEELKRRFPRGNVEQEKDFVDLRVVLSGQTYLIEVKKEPRPQHAVRSALGQLIAYGAQSRVSRRSLRLIVAAPGRLCDSDKEFIERVNSLLGVSISYLELPLARRARFP